MSFVLSFRRLISAWEACEQSPLPRLKPWYLYFDVLLVVGNLFAWPCGQSGSVRVILVFLAGTDSAHPHSIASVDFKSMSFFGLRETVEFVICGLGLILVLLCFMTMLQDVIDELVHAFFAFEASALDALEALSIGLLSEHLLLIWQHNYILPLSIIEKISAKL